jgi:hypothetical protein
MRRVIEREVSPVEAVKVYHATLASKGIRPILAMADDVEISDPVLRPGSVSKVRRGLVAGHGGLGVAAAG